MEESSMPLAEPTDQKPTETIAPHVVNEAPAAAVTAVTAGSNAGIIILQWLTYAFWGWTVLSLAILTSLVISTFMKDTTAGGSFTPYAIAAVVVLMPIAAICDFFYSKHEPQHKNGAAMVVMVIHAVIFALFGIGSLIGVVFALVQLGTSNGDPTNTLSNLFTALIIALIYGATFVRTLNPAKLSFVRRAYIIFMIIVVATITVLGFIGPVAQARIVRNDNLITANLPSVVTGIGTYTSNNKGLPADLGAVKLIGDAKTLVDSSLVEYTPNTMPKLVGGSAAPKAGAATPLSSGDVTYYYSLCVTYTRADSASQVYNTPESTDSSGYSSYLSTYGHPAGKVCYKLKNETFN